MAANVIETTKNGVKSHQFLIEGISYAGKKTLNAYLIALRFFNQALCFAPQNSEHVFNAIKNREFIYQSLQITNPYPHHVKNGLQGDYHDKHNTVKDEKTSMHISKPISTYVPLQPKLRYSASEQVPFIANCLLKHPHTNNYATNRDLKVGDIVAILEPVLSTIPTQYQQERCGNCLTESSQYLVPCKKCTAVMFCSMKCSNEAMKSFHKYECPTIHLINSSCDYRWMRLALRIITSALSLFDTIDAFLDFTTESMKKDLPKRIPTNQHFDKDKYEFLCSLSKAITIPNPSDAETLFTVCTKIFEANKILSVKKPEEFTKIMRNIVEQHLCMVYVHGTIINDPSVEVYKRVYSTQTSPVSIDSYMTAIYPFANYISHSCAPNVFSSNYGSKKILSIIRPIEAGQPLSMCKYLSYYNAKIELRKLYMPILCDCIACNNNYPLLNDLPDSGVDFPFDMKEALLEHWRFDKEVVLSKFQLTVDYLQNNDINTPSRRLAEMMKYYSRCMEIIYCKELCIGMSFIRFTKSLPIQQDVQILQT